MEGESGLTGSGAILGTPSYMAPEQAAGQTREVGPATDVYALGAILYELLVGRPPFRAATAMDTILQVIGADPVPPTQLQPHVPRDLENICLKCLHKEPARRYPTALALAADLAAFREGRPVAARPIGAWERAVKWARRRPAVAALAGVSLLVSLVAFALVTWQWRVARQALATAESALEQTERARQDEQQQRLAKDTALREAKASLYFNRIALAEREWSASDVPGVLALLQGAPPELRHWEWHYLYRLCHGGQLTLPGRDCVAISPDDRLIASATGKQVKVWELATGREPFALASSKGHSARVNQVTFSKDGKQLASVSDDGTARIWNAATGEVFAVLEPPTAPGESRAALRAVAFDPSGKQLAIGGDAETVLLWDIAGGKIACTLAGHTDTVTSVAFSPDGRWLASASKDRTVRLWDPAAGRAVHTLSGHTAAVRAAAFSSDSRLVASASEDHTVKLWDPAAGTELRRLIAQPAPVNALCFHRDGLLATVSGDYLKAGELRTWDAATGQPLRTFRWPAQEITGVAFSADGKRLVTADQRAVIVWDATNDLESRALRGHREGVMAAAFSPQDAHLASVGEDWTLKIWDVGKEAVIHDCVGHTATINAVAYTPDGTRVVTASDDRTIKVWDSATGMPLRTLEGHTAAVLSVAISPDGRTLASAACTPDRPGEVKLWDVPTGRETRTLPARWIRTLAFSGDGKRLAGGVERPFQVVVWEAATGRELRTHSGFFQPVSAVAFSPDGRWLAAAGGSKQEGIIKLWNVASGEEREPIRTRTGRIGSIAFSPDGRRLVASSWDHTLMLFEPQTRQDVLTLRGHTDGVTAVAFSRDGDRIASVSRDRTVRLWNATPLPSSRK
jgi:WD40 repeat protein